MTTQSPLDSSTSTGHRTFTGALLCVALMVFMMVGMGHGSGGDHK